MYFVLNHILLESTSIFSRFQLFFFQCSISLLGINKLRFIASLTLLLIVIPSAGFGTGRFKIFRGHSSNSLTVAFDFVFRFVRFRTYYVTPSIFFVNTFFEIIFYFVYKTSKSGNFLHITHSGNCLNFNNSLILSKFLILKSY